MSSFCLWIFSPLTLQVSHLAGWTLAILAYLKAHLAPTHASDRKFSGSRVYDLFMGVEHNPRIAASRGAQAFDFKLFFNGRPGILAWTIILVCFAAEQFARFGCISNSMLLLILLQSLYVLDFFRNEGWYVRTIDITHEHFGFYLAWGDLVWLPFMYTLQALFLSSHPVNLSPLAFSAIAALGVGGYVLFRRVNAEKDRFRTLMQQLGMQNGDEAAAAAESSNGSASSSSKGERKGSDSHASEKEHKPVGAPVELRGHTVYELSSHRLWGRPLRYLSAPYLSGSGSHARLRHSTLLVSGCWGMARHLNYLGDLLLSLAFCLTCGTSHLLPYFYFVFMLILLLHRVKRDDERCRAKYGAVWQQYCDIVPYKLIPGIY